jgi:xylulokinase
MGLDVGTTGCKALVMDPDGETISFSYREYALVHPKPGWSELDPSAVWRCIGEVVAEAAQGAKGDPVEALGVSVQGEATVPVDSAGRHLYNFIVTFDERTEEQCRWWERSFGRSRLFRITGMPLHPMYSINKMMWFLRRRPRIFERTWKFLCMEDYVLMKLGVEPAIDHSLAARTMALDIHTREWSDFILHEAGVDRGMLAVLLPSGEIAGRVAPALAASLGLSTSAVAVTGGHDQCCGALGAGVVREGMALNATGTSDVLQPVFLDIRLEDAVLQNNYCCYPHVKPSMHTCCAFNLTGGLLLRWYRDTFWKPEMREADQRAQDVYEIIIDGASKTSPPLFVLPHFVGSGTPALDPHASGAMLGLHLSTTREEMSRAMLDSLNYELRLNSDALEDSGIAIEEIVAVGGGAKSRRWLQLKADTLGKTVVSLSTSEAACLGAAILAGTAVGTYASVDEGVANTVKRADEYVPRAEEHKRHTERYHRYRRIYPLLKSLNIML